MVNMDNYLGVFCCKGKQKKGVVVEGGDGAEEGVYNK